MIEDCPFCERAGFDRRVAWDSEPEATRGLTVGRSSAAFPDQFPVTHGHMLVVPRRHVPDVFQLDRDEQESLWSMVTLVADNMSAQGIKGMNIGMNIGATGGQTVEHAHIHVIPRREGDVDDPRGGIRWVLPDKARYWEPFWA